MDDEDLIKARHDMKQITLFTFGGIALVALLALLRLLIR